MDPSLLQDFLTESGELIEQLDADLVKLESSESDEAQELCNGCFRALHTIKGAASFLGLTAVTTFAHAAEDALNRLRKGEVGVTEEVMDALLRANEGYATPYGADPIMDEVRARIRDLFEAPDIQSRAAAFTQLFPEQTTP